MKPRRIYKIARYQEIVDEYMRKGCLTNDYLCNKVSGLIMQGSLYEYCGQSNAFLLVKKDTCMRLYYYLNDLNELFDFDIKDNLVVEIIFKGDLGTPYNDMDYLTKSGFTPHLRRDQYGGIYKDLKVPRGLNNVHVRKAQTKDEVFSACALFNRIFDHYSGDFISAKLAEKLYTERCIWVAKDENDQFAGALHQTIERNVAWISHVAVQEKNRGRGIGSALIDTFVEQNRIDDKSRYMLWVQAHNNAAVNMYQEKGFKYMNKSTISMLKKNNYGRINGFA